LAKRRLEFLVEGTPDVVLNMVQGFFEKEEWSPYPVQWDRNVLGGGRSRRAVVTRLDDPIKGHNKVVASISAFPILEAPLGFLELVALSLLTAGLIRCGPSCLGSR